MPTHKHLLTASLSTLLFLLVGCDGCRQTAMKAWSKTYQPQGDPSQLSPVFDGPDAKRPRIPIRLHPVASGFPEVTDLQSVPGQPGLWWVLQKPGTLSWIRLTADSATTPGTAPSSPARGSLARLPVLTSSEEGLLGLAFHPRFSENGRFYLNYVAKHAGKDATHIAEWKVTPGATPENASAQEVRVLLTVEQPYPNHNAGQLAFGPDGYLYVGFGDGGWKDDPLKAGQDRQNLLGKMLRLEVDPTLPAPGYRLPKDNPFLGRKDTRPEIFALGLRNPWRYSFSPDGKLIVADVGQSTWEEVSIVPSGANLGWSQREAFHCFPPERACSTDGMTDPIYAYGRDDGQSITGGYVYLGEKIPALRGQYVFGDFVTGRIWALKLPDTPTAPPPTASSLGRWPILISTFGRDPQGSVYVGDFGSGQIFRIDAALP